MIARTNMRDKPFKLLEDPSMTKRIERIVAEMTIEQKAGQLITFEFCGTRITPDVIRAIREFHCGGLRITPHIHTALAYGVRHQVQGLDVQRLSPYAGPVEYAALLNELQQMAADRPLGIPLLISIDQEGDWSEDYARGGVNFFPSQMGMTATGDPDLVYRAYRAVAAQQRTLGATMMHSPCLDVNTNPANPEIGTRSFSDDPKVVAELALRQFNAFRDEGIVATGKHFPGRGDSAVDVHFSLDTFHGDRERMERVELYPYRKLIEAGLPAIMTAHTIYPALDDSNTPASVSRRIVTDFLRGEMGFEGVITTDAMGMKGVVDLFDSFGQACAAALAAGNDLVLAKGDPALQPSVIEAVLRYLDQGKIDIGQIDDSVRRVLRMKMQYRLFDTTPYAVEPAGALETIRRPEIIELSRQVAADCLSVVRDEQNLLPLAKDTRIFVTDQHNWPLFGKADDIWYHSHMLAEFFRKKAADPLVIDDWETRLLVSQEDEEVCMDKAADADVIVVLTYALRSNVPNTELLKKLIASGKPVITISNCPYEKIAIPEAKTLILTYSCMPRSLERAVDVIYGNAKPGKMHWPLKDYTIRGVK